LALKYRSQFVLLLGTYYYPFVCLYLNYITLDKQCQWDYNLYYDMETKKNRCNE
jgi:hypothetical protein